MLVRKLIFDRWLQGSLLTIQTTGWLANRRFQQGGAFSEYCAIHWCQNCGTLVLARIQGYCTDSTEHPSASLHTHSLQCACCCCCSNKTYDLDQEPTANTLALTMRNFIIFQYHALLTHFNVFKNISPNWWSHYKVQLFSCQFWSSHLDNIIIRMGGLLSSCERYLLQVSSVTIFRI